jgi:hypothetical protein
LSLSPEHSHVEYNARCGYQKIETSCVVLGRWALGEVIKISLIYNSQKLERTQMPLNRGMDTENVVHLHNETTMFLKLILFSRSIENENFSQDRKFNSLMHFISILNNGKGIKVIHKFSKWISI